MRYLPTSATILKRKIPIPVKIFLVIGIPGIAWGLQGALFVTRQYDVAAFAFFVLGGFLMYTYQNDRSYQIAWDDETLYNRDWGFRNILFQRKDWFAIRFDDIRSIKGKFKDNPAGMSKFVPFEYLEVKAKDRKTDDVWIYPLALRDDDLLLLLQHIQNKFPDMLPNSVHKSLTELP